MKDEKLFEGIHEEVIDDLYIQYDLDHIMAVTRHIHPMFYNGTFSRDNSYQPEKPEPLLSKEEFEKKLMLYDFVDKWTTGYEILYSYIARLRKRAATQSDQMKQF